MDKNNHDSSTFSVPGTMQDVTLLCTPLPKATSTATKRRSLIIDKDTELTWAKDDQLEVGFETKLNLTSGLDQDISSDPERLSPSFVVMDESQRKLDRIAEAYKNANDMKEKAVKEMTELKAKLYRGNSSITVTGSSGLTKYSPNVTGNSSQYDGRTASGEGRITGSKQASLNKSNKNKDFEFRVPLAPAKRLEKNIQIENTRLNKYKTELQMNLVGTRMSEVPKVQGDYLTDLPVDQRYDDGDRSSVCSSTSSLGILSADVLEDEKDKPLVRLSDAEKLDFSLRLAKELNLDTSQLKDGKLDISHMLSNRMKEKISSAQRDEDKENRSGLQSGRSSESSVLYGYGSDISASSKNNTAKEFPQQSLDGLDTPAKESSTSSSRKPLAEQNYTPSREAFLQKSTGSNARLSYQMSDSKMSLASNPFSDCSKLSIASEEFRSSEDAVARLLKDEESWRGSFSEARRTLSGIYGDCDISIGTQGEKMSISSFLRSGSGPLGCLDNGSGGTPRPTFGRPVISPEKKSKARPMIKSPPKSKLTFVLEDEKPTKDTAEPWHPKSLLEQHSLIHSHAEEYDESEVSVPSLSCIGQLLSEMQGKLSTEDVMNRLLESTKNASKKKKRNEADLSRLDGSVLSHCGDREQLKSVSVVAGGDNDLQQGNDLNHSFLSLCDGEAGVTDRQRTTWAPNNHSVITIDDSVNPSVCNITDFDGEEEEYVCVLTPESMDFDIFNEYPREQRYHISKTCYLNNQRHDSAAVVHLSDESLTLQPGEKRVVNVTVAAAVEGCIKIKIEVIRFDTVTKESETNKVFGKIVAEIPKVSMLSPSFVEMKPLVDSLGVEIHGMYKGDLQLKNDGHSVVPVKLVLSQSPESSKEPLERFYFNNDKSQIVHCSLKPGATLTQAFYCQSPPVLECSKTATARVDVCLNTPVPVALKSLQSISFRADLKRNFFSAPTLLHVTSDKMARCELHNNSPIPYTIETSVASGYYVQPSSFTIPPNQTFVIHAGYYGGPNTSGMLMLKINEPDEVVHFMNIVLLPPAFGSARSSINTVTPQSSRATSPTSPCSSISSLGNLRLACTHKELVWGGCALQQKVIRTCTIKNLSNHREKLLLKITDQHKCFKILNENSLSSEVKLCLQPLESRQLCVVMLAGSIGAKWGHLTVARISSPNDKKVLFLYAFGGKAKVNIEGVMQDPEQHMWLYLDSKTLSSSFTLTNVGDYAAFVKISEGVTATTVGGGISIAPPEQIVLPGQSVSVEISLSVTLERLEYLLAQPSQAAVCITRLTVTHGDESTRRRLARLSRLDPKLASKLSLLSQLLPQSPIPDLDKLGEDCSCAETLWLEDVSEWTIGVLVKRSVLESLKLDTSYDYIDLATTVIH